MIGPEGSWDAVVVGSGIGGLTAGALFARAGKRVLVVERNASFGGAASTYQVGSLTIEASLHEIDGLDAEDVKRPILERLGVHPSVDFVDVGDLWEVRSPVLGAPFRMPHGLEGARAAVTARFPRHERAFKEYLDRIVAIRRVYTYVGRTKAWPRWRRLAALPVFPVRTLPLMRNGKLSLADELERSFGDDEAVKLALAAHIGYFGADPARLWFPFWAVAQASYHVGGGHYPRGGSARLVEHLLGVIREAGGDAVAGRQLSRIVVEDGRVAGIEHEARKGPDGFRRERAPVVFGNAAPPVLAEALPEAERTAFAAKYADDTPATSLFTLALGLDRQPRELGIDAWSTVVFPGWMESLGSLPANVDLTASAPGNRDPYLVIVDYNAVEAGLPRPPYLLTVTGLDRAENWAGGEPEYRARREVWSQAVLDVLEREFPGISGSVVERDMTTGRSVAAYLNTPSGAVYGFETEPPRKGRVVPSRETTAVPGLFLASAFTRFGGYTGSIMGGALAYGAASRYLGRV